MNFLETIMYKPFRGLNWYQKIIGILLFVPVVYPLAFYHVFIKKDW